MDSNGNNSDALFFPPLVTLLSGRSRLLSLRDVLNALSVAPEACAENDDLQKFCYDAATYNLFTTSPDALPKPSARSRSDYEARTAPIQVSGSQNGEYDLDQMKQDALELSGQLGVDESFALRMVVLEWQSRAEEQLLSGAAHSESTAELGLSVSTRGSQALHASVNGRSRPAIDFRDDATRRRRQLNIYLQERSSRLKLCASLMARGATIGSIDSTETWVDDLARQIFCDRTGLHTDTPKVDQLIEKCLNALEEQMKVLDDISDLPKLAQASEENMLLYAAATFTDIVSLMRMLLVAASVQTAVPSSTLVLTWYRKLESVNYFLTLPPSPAWPDTTELQCLVSMIAFTMLNATVTADTTASAMSPSAGDVNYPRLGPTGYIEDEDCIKELTSIFYRAALDKVSILSPAILAWTYVTLPIRDMALRQTEMRERALMNEDGLSDIDTYGRRRPTRADSRVDSSLYEKLYAAMQSMEMDSEIREDPPQWFGYEASQTVYGVVASLSTTLSSLYHSDLDLALQSLVRGELLRFMGYSTPAGKLLAEYSGEVVETVLSVLQPDEHATAIASNAVHSHLCSVFVNHPALRQYILEDALLRYPYELSSLLRLLTTLAAARTTIHDIQQLLEQMRTLTLQMPMHYNEYTLVNEEMNASEIQIEDDLHLFVSRQALSWYGSGSRRALTSGAEEQATVPQGLSIPQGTKATVLNDERPMVVKLEYGHSVFQYLALLLSTCLPNSEMCVAPDMPPLDLATSAEIIALINAFLTAATQGDKPEHDAKLVLDEVNAALPAEMDFAYTVTQIFETQLAAQQEQSNEEGSLDLLVACAGHLGLMVKVDAGRTWSIIARSSLLGLNGAPNSLAAVVSTVESALGQYRFLTACSSIFKALVDDAIGGLISRRPVEQPVKRGRFDSPIESNQYTPERTMQRVLSTYTSVMLDALRNIEGWRFAGFRERSSITASICGSFLLLVKAIYGLRIEEVADDQDMTGRPKRNDQRLASVLFPAADAVLQGLAPAGGTSTSIQAFVAAFKSATVALQASPATPDLAQVKRLASMIELLILLLRILRQDGNSDERAYSVAMQLVAVLPQLAIILTLEPSLKCSIASLLADTIYSLNIASERADPPSLLSQLATPSAKALLSVLCRLNQPLGDAVTRRQIWNFMVAAMKGRQQWLAHYLLSGTVPKESLTASTAGIASKSMLTMALDQLFDFDNVDVDQNVAVMTFVSASQGASVWASNEVRKHGTFLKNIVDWLQNMKYTETRTTSQQMDRTSEARLASVVCEVLAQVVHSSVEIGDQAVLKILTGKLGFVSAHGHEVGAWNRSLHQNLSDNFRSRFGGVDVESFKRGISKTAGSLGDASIEAYDLEIMDMCLGHEWVWAGSIDRAGKSSGFRNEVVRANVNFALLEAQAGLLKAWSALATTLVDSLPTIADESLRADLSKSLAVTARHCLEANAEADLDVPGMDKVITTRAEIAFIILSKLAKLPPTPVTKAILPAAQRALRAAPADFDVATQTEDPHYYRLGLQTLVLAVQPHIHLTAPKQAKATSETPVSYLDPSVAAVLADIVTTVVAPAWRALAGNLHTNVSCALPGDFALVVALMQAVLSVSGISAVYAQIAETVAALQLVRSTLSLYSWSDKLAAAIDTGGASDPVYGELAIQFLRILSGVRPVAEHVAVEAALPQLAAANLSSYLRKPGGKGPVDEPRRMFCIWSEGLLPLCLNLLDAVGPPVAAEVAGFLNGFPAQLARANAALEDRQPTKFDPAAGAITLGVVQEAHALCLITMILTTDSARAAAEGVDLPAFAALSRSTSGKSTGKDEQPGTEGPLQGYSHRKVIGEAKGLLRARATLHHRIAAASEVELAWQGRMADATDDVLSKKISDELYALASLVEDDESSTP